MAAAFEAFWQDANEQERQQFLREWGALSAVIDGQAWGRVRQLAQSLGATWLPGRQAGFTTLQRAIGRQQSAP